MTATAAPLTSPTAPRSRVGTAALWTTQVVVALGFLFAASGKLMAVPVAVAPFVALGAPWLAPVVAVLQILGAVALFVPRLVGIAAAAFALLAAGAVVTHALVGGSPAPALVLGVLATVVAVARRHEIAALLAVVRR